jgi:hypothetical protein
MEFGGLSTGIMHGVHIGTIEKYISGVWPISRYRIERSRTVSRKLTKNIKCPHDRKKTKLFIVLGAMEHKMQTFGSRKYIKIHLGVQTCLQTQHVNTLDNKSGNCKTSWNGAKRFIDVLKGNPGMEP